MEIDRAEINREENIKADRKQADLRRQSTNAAKQIQSFEAHYKAQLKNKLDKDISESQKKESEKESKKNELSFQRILEVSKKKEDQKKDENFFLRKKEEKKEKDEEKVSSKKTESVSIKEEQTKKVDSISEREGGGQGRGGQGGGGQQGDGSKEGKGGGGFSGDGQSQKHFNHEKKALAKEISKKTFATKITSLAGASLKDSKKDSKSHLSEKTYQEIVKKVSLLVSENKDATMQIELDDSFFNGLKLNVSKTKDGVCVAFVCPNWEVKKLFLSHKLSIYAKLKETGIKVNEVSVL